MIDVSFNIDNIIKKMHISAEAVAIGWMIPSVTNSLPADEQTDYHKHTLS